MCWRGIKARQQSLADGGARANLTSDTIGPENRVAWNCKISRLRTDTRIAA
jgi:hypothetical protein